MPFTKRFLLRHTLIAVAVLTVLAPAALAAKTTPQTTQATAAQKLTPLSWPRNFEVSGEHVELYQPEIEKWEGNRMSGRAAVAVGAKDGTPTHGVARFSAQADIDKPSALVQLSNI